MILIPIILLIFITCGAPDVQNIDISGNITLGDSITQDGSPIMVAVAQGDSIDLIKDDPMDAIIKIVSVNENDNTYQISLTTTEVSVGDDIMIFAYIDKDYNNGIPEPTLGDFVGFYSNKDSMKTAYTLKTEDNNNLDITVNREVFDFDATVAGTVEGTDVGELTIVLYAGEITSSNFSELDSAGVIGYKKITKSGFSASYDMDVIPYGKDMPAGNVYVLAMLDINGDGEINNNDKVSYYSISENKLPSAITLFEGDNPGVNIDFDFTSMTIKESAGYNISLRGTFSKPTDYTSDPASGPIYVIVSSLDDMSSLTDDMSDSIKYFKKMPQGEFYFDLDLSSTDLVPGDKVAVIALWDKDSSGGFPDPSEGDALGLIQNKDSYSMTVQLWDGENAVPSEGYDFKINKKIYDFTATMQYAIDMSNSGTYNNSTAQLMILLIHYEGVDINVTSDNIDVKLDMDYVLGVSTHSPPEYDYIGIGDRTDPTTPRSMDILTVLYNEITVWQYNEYPNPLIMGQNHGEDNETTAYLFAILDKNGNGELDQDDELGYYAESNVVVDETINIPGYGDVTIPNGTYYLPSPIKRITKGNNVEDRDGSTGPYWILMNKRFEGE